MTEHAEDGYGAVPGLEEPKLELEGPETRPGLLAPKEVRGLVVCELLFFVRYKPTRKAANKGSCFTCMRED